MAADVMVELCCIHGVSAAVLSGWLADVSRVCSASVGRLLPQQFLTRALMPLHKPKCVAMYHQQLAYCVTQVGGAPLQHCSDELGSSSNSDSNVRVVHATG
jgi:hypothetical protein